MSEDDFVTYLDILEELVRVAGVSVETPEYREARQVLLGYVAKLRAERDALQIVLDLAHDFIVASDEYYTHLEDCSYYHDEPCDCGYREVITLARYVRKQRVHGKGNKDG